jgi:hypothetical protein
MLEKLKIDQYGAFLLLWHRWEFRRPGEYRSNIMRYIRVVFEKLQTAPGNGMKNSAHFPFQALSISLADAHKNVGPKETQ